MLFLSISTTLVVMSDKLLGSLEQKIMDVLWLSDSPLKPAEVLQKLKGKYAYTTIMTELKRMYDKKILSRKLTGRVFYYSPLKSKETVAKGCLCGHFGDLVSSYGSLAISQFVDVVSQNPQDLELLKKYLNDNSK